MKKFINLFRPNKNRHLNTYLLRKFFLSLIILFLFNKSSYSQCTCSFTNPGNTNLITYLGGSTISAGTYCLFPTENFVIGSTEVLTLDNCILKAAEGVKITVQIGGRLILQNGAMITKGSSGCNNWLGIVVEGAGGADQQTIANQGYLSITDGTVSFADVGVFVDGGGIIKTNGAIFTDNLQDIQIEPYLDPGVANECEFVATSFLTSDLNNSTRVIMDQIEGIAFYGCTFQNGEDWNNATAITDMGTGIFASSCQFIVTGLDFVLGDPYGCFESHTAPSAFYNFSQGIVANFDVSEEDRYVIIEDATFILNFHSIRSANTEDFVVRFCTFTHLQGMTPAPLWDLGFTDVLINFGKADKVHNINNNSFETDMDFNASGLNIFSYANTEGGVIFVKNTCESADYPVTATVSSPTDGLYLEEANTLAFACNEFINCHHDLYNRSGITSIGNSGLEYVNIFSSGANNISNIASVNTFTYFREVGQTAPYLPVPNGGMTNILLDNAADDIDCSGCNPALGEGSPRPGQEASIKMVRITKTQLELELINLDHTKIAEIDIINMFNDEKEIISDIQGKTINFEFAKQGFYAVLIRLNDGSVKTFKVYIE